MTESTDTALRAFITACPDLQYIEISGSEQEQGNVHGRVLDDLREEPLLGRNLKQICVLDQRYYNHTFRRAAMKLARARETLSIQAGMTTGGVRGAETWLEGKIFGEEKEFPSPTWNGSRALRLTGSPSRNQERHRRSRTPKVKVEKEPHVFNDGQWNRNGSFRPARSPSLEVVHSRPARPAVGKKTYFSNDGQPDHTISSELNELSLSGDVHRHTKRPREGEEAHVSDGGRMDRNQSFEINVSSQTDNAHRLIKKPKVEEGTHSSNGVGLGGNAPSYGSFRPTRSPSLEVVHSGPVVPAMGKETHFSDDGQSKHDASFGSNDPSQTDNAHSRPGAVEVEEVRPTNPPSTESVHRGPKRSEAEGKKRVTNNGHSNCKDSSKLDSQSAAGKVHRRSRIKVEEQINDALSNHNNSSEVGASLLAREAHHRPEAAEVEEVRPIKVSLLEVVRRGPKKPEAGEEICFPGPSQSSGDKSSEVNPSPLVVKARRRPEAAEAAEVGPTKSCHGPRQPEVGDETYFSNDGQSPGSNSLSPPGEEHCRPRAAEVRGKTDCSDDGQSEYVRPSGSRESFPIGDEYRREKNGERTCKDRSHLKALISIEKSPPPEEALGMNPPQGETENIGSPSDEEFPSVSELLARDYERTTKGLPRFSEILASDDEDSIPGAEDERHRSERPRIDYAAMSPISEAEYNRRHPTPPRRPMNHEFHAYAINKLLFETEFVRADGEELVFQRTARSKDFIENVVHYNDYLAYYRQ